ncbi:hypothetical protein ACHAP8_009585 [Fusarium lateritium]
MSVITSPTMSDMSTEINWPILKSYLEEDKVTFEDLKLPCGICYDTMTVLPHQHQEDDNHNTHNAVIFPCGHIFGKSCIEEAFGENSSLSSVCFACRTDLTHPKCGHTNFGKPMPNRKEDVCTIPATLSNNGLIPQNCGTCIINKIIRELQDHARELNKEPTNNQYLVLSYQTSPNTEPTFCWPFDTDLNQYDNLVECQPPIGTQRTLKGFEVAQRFVDLDLSWVDEPISDYKFRFYMWTPPAEDMAMVELCSEFSKLQFQPKVQNHSIISMFYKLMEKSGIEDEDEDEDEE